MSATKAAHASGPSVAIIGAGIGGISFGIALKRQLGFENFTIYEKAHDVGGTWRDNIYPGCSSDVPVPFYSLSTDLKPDWSASHAFAPEIQSYWAGLAKKYDLYRHCVFGTTVVSAEWDAAEQLYHIVMEDVETGEQTRTTAQILISALGILEIPRLPNISGISNFKGELFHSARWDTKVDLKGKRVAVIGNGASATQFVPIIAADSSVQVTQFCRTPNYYGPPLRTTYTPFKRWAFRNVPYLMRFWRNILFFRSELLYYTVFKSKIFPSFLANASKGYIERTAPAKYLENLIPKYVMGCKRLLIDTNYLPSLHQPNMSLNWDGIASIAENGIITKKGDLVPFDVLIFATGFTVDSYPIPIRGVKSQTVKEYYDSQGGPKAYLGTVVPGFPNLHILSGPNTATGHTSVIYTQEIQIDYIIQVIKPIIERKALSFDVSSAATDDYNDKIHSRLAQSVFVSCNSWYRTGGNGKIWSIFPGSGTLFWWTLRRPNWDHFVGVGAKRWNQELRRKKYTSIFKRSLYTILLAGAVYLFREDPAGTAQLITERALGLYKEVAARF